MLYFLVRLLLAALLAVGSMLSWQCMHEVYEFEKADIILASVSFIMSLIVFYALISLLLAVKEVKVKKFKL